MKVMFNNRFLLAAPLVLVALTLASFFSLTTRSVSADDVVDDVSIRVNVSCTMSGSGMNTHNATVNPGTYETNIGETTFRVFCNDNEGFAIYAIGFTDDTDGKNVLTSAAVGSTYDIATGTGTSGNSQWAMKLATDANATYPITLQNGFGSWHTVPDDYILVAKRTADTDVGVEATGASFTSTYQVYASSSQPSGNYTGRVKYVMVHPATHFAPVACNPSATTIAEVKCMQDFASQNRDAIVTSMALEQQYTLKDNRDGKTYTVAKLADGKVWMTQNLDLDITGAELSSLNTDLVDGSLSGIYSDANGYRVEDGVVYWTPSGSTLIGDCDEGCIADDWFDSNTTPVSVSFGDLYMDVPVMYSFTSVSDIPYSSNGEHGAIGNHYNWTAAIASNNSSSLTSTNTDANNSICPAGWRLPKATGDTSSATLDEFNRLSNQYDAEFGASPLYFINTSQVYTVYDYGWINDFKYLGFYWTSTTSNVEDGAYRLYMYTVWSSNTDSGDRYLGATIRCIAR